MFSFEQFLMVGAYSGFAFIVGFLVWLSAFYKSPYKKLIEYGIQCKNNGVDMFDTLKLLEHYAYWDLDIRDRDLGGNPERKDKAQMAALKARDIAFFGEETRESTKPRIKIPANI